MRRRIGANEALRKLENGHHRNGDLLVSSFARHRLHQLAGGLALAFGGYSSRRVEQQSQAGGSNGSR